MNKKYITIAALLLGFTGIWSLSHQIEGDHNHAHGENDYHSDEKEKGPQGGKLLIAENNEDFTVEFKVDENNGKPLFNLYAYDNGELISPKEVNYTVSLNRLDGEVNNFNFMPKDTYAVSDAIVAEPHSFDVKVTVSYEGKTYNWAFDSYEGRTQIDAQAAQDAGVKTSAAQAGTIAQKVKLEGRILLNPYKTANIGARFSGVVKSLKVNLGDKVKKGQVLGIIESNESLNSLKLIAPRSGTVTAVDVMVGSIVNQERILQIADLSDVWAEFHLFPSDMPLVKKGQKITTFSLDNKDLKTASKVERISGTADLASQTALIITSFKNTDMAWKPDMHVEAEVVVNNKNANLIVKETALQKFRDFTVVFAKIKDTYEVRMLELGASDGEHVEVLSGLKEGTEYVSENSFLIKADVEKSGASHDH